MTNCTDNTKMIKQSTLTFNSILLASVVQIPFIIAILYPETLGILFIESSNMTDIFCQYKLICSDFWIKEIEKIRKLPLYYNIFIGKYIKSLIQPSESIWSTICKPLWSWHKNQDFNQQIYFRYSPECYKDKIYLDLLDILYYYD